MDRQVRLLAARQPGAEILRLPLDPRFRPLSDLRLALRLRRVLDPGRADIVHAHGLKTAWALVLARPPIPVVWTCHGWPEARGFSAPLARLALKICLEVFPCIAVSPSLSRKLRRLSPRGRIFCVENGLEEDFLRFLPSPEEGIRALGLPPSLLSEGKTFFSFLGRLTREKGIDRFLRAAALILAAEPRAAALVAGSGPEEGAVRKAEERWRGRLFYVGFQRDVRSLLSLSRFLLLPARREGFGLASLEARAWGVPVVAAAGSGVHLPTDPQEAGILTVPPAPELLAQAGLRLIREERFREALSRRGRERARSLTLGRQLEKTAAVYLEVLGIPGYDGMTGPGERSLDVPHAEKGRGKRGSRR